MLQSRDPGFTWVFHPHISGFFLSLEPNHTPAFLLPLLPSRKDTVGLGSLKTAALICWFCASLVIPSLERACRVPTFKFSLSLQGSIGNRPPSLLPSATPLTTASSLLSSEMPKQDEIDEDGVFFPHGVSQAF